MSTIFNSLINIGMNMLELCQKDQPVAMDSFHDHTNGKRTGMRSSDVYKGVVYQARHDVVCGYHDSDVGYVEVKHAKEGDDLEVIGSEIYRPERGFVVRNHNNYDEIFTVQANDLCDAYGLQAWPGLNM